MSLVTFSQMFRTKKKILTALNSAQRKIIYGYIRVCKMFTHKPTLKCVSLTCNTHCIFTWRQNVFNTFSRKTNMCWYYKTN